MAKGSITSTNAVLTLAIAGVFPQPQQIQNFSADDIYTVDDVEPVETAMSLDGFLSGGVVPVPINQSFMLMANSASIVVFDNWYYAQKQVGDIFTAEGRVSLGGISKKFVQTRGFLVGYKPMPDAQKTLKPRKFVIRWQSVTPAAQ